MKAAGIEIVVKKKKFVVEDHHDDCGDDLSSLGPVDDTTRWTSGVVFSYVCFC